MIGNVNAIQNGPQSSQISTAKSARAKSAGTTLPSLPNSVAFRPVTASPAGAASGPEIGDPESANNALQFLTQNLGGQSGAGLFAQANLRTETVHRLLD